jgi:ATP-dependent DNA helicase RecG
MHRVLSESARDRLCTIPPAICQRAGLLPPWKAILELHEPRRIPAEVERSDAERSLAFEELFFYCLSLANRKRWLSDRKGISFAGESPRLKAMRANLPFTLTGTQERIMETIQKDMASAKPMNRLLQGDVGSGKTILAFLAALIAIDHGYQVAFLAPTEILAEQHLKNLSQWSRSCDVTVGLLIGGQPALERKRVLEETKAGKTHILVGTHALLEGGVAFPRLGFVVVDEQHRFGVQQRATIRGKGFDPDVLVMSATPIPRTLALTLYGDLDVSILNELPAGRKPIATRLFRESERERVYQLVRDEVQAGHQVFMVYPLVNASDRIDLKDATTMASHLQEEVFKELKLGLLHGQMPSAEKEKLMRRFRTCELDVLVATTVIEVGIDIPNATVMVIEHPERFGLSQLHQLRGRVGRGSERSNCYLMVPQGITRQARERLAIFSRIHDGFLLAEEDLRLRGPGDFFGVAQSGFPTFQVARFPRDLDLLEAARREAFQLLGEDPEFKKSSDSHIPWVLDHVWSDRIRLVQVG